MIVLVDSNEQTADKNSRDDHEKYVKQLRDYYSHVIETNLGMDVQIPLENGLALAIERKNPTDFLASISDGRLENQIEKMHNACKFVAVLVTGSLNWANEYVIADNRKTEWKSVDVRGMIRTIQLSGTIIDYCPPSRYAEQIGEIYNTCNHEHGRHIIKRRIVTFPPIDERIQYLCQLPGVRLVRAESLLNWVGMMDGVLPDGDGNTYGELSSVFHWLSIMGQIDKGSRPKGWGPNLILTLRKFLGLKSNQYIKVEEE